MNLRQRIQNFAFAALMILGVILMLNWPEYGVLAAGMVFSIILTVTGIRFLVYYFTMARFAVGGKIMLFIGMIVLDAGLLITSIVLANGMVLLYFLQFIYGIYGVLDIVQGIQAKRNGAPMWKYTMINGAINITIVVFAFICLNITRSEAMLLYILCAGMLYMAANRIISAFRKTAVVYIQ